MSKKIELQKKGEKELLELLEEKRKGLWKFHFGASGSKARNVKEGRTLRRDIARVLTALSARNK
ncbi:MAG TPA: 50S ribosomal protein L29 [Candidatus Paceibacterota bacterium]